MAAQDDRPYELRFGAHILRFEPPDLYLSIRDGDVSAAEMSTTIDAINRFAEGKRWILAIVPMERHGATSMEARRHLLRITPRLRGAAYVGASFQQRMAVTGVTDERNAPRHGADAPMVFVATEEEARVWIAARRRFLEAEAQAKPEGPTTS
jgi:hypothetical protein